MDSNVDCTIFSWNLDPARAYTLQKAPSVFLAFTKAQKVTDFKIRKLLGRSSCFVWKSFAIFLVNRIKQVVYPVYTLITFDSTGYYMQTKRLYNSNIFSSSNRLHSDRLFSYKKLTQRARTWTLND